MLVSTSHSNKLSNCKGEAVHGRTDDIQDLVSKIERKRASCVTVQDLIRYALAHDIALSEITSSGALPR